MLEIQDFFYSFHTYQLQELKINYLLKIQLLTDELEKAKGGTVAEVKQ